ncbi:MAG: VOC family protein [Alphaproteobacteria bacterium]
MAESRPGTFMWNELLTTDVESARAFYSDVVGWTRDSVPMPGEPGAQYHLWKAGEDTAGGMMAMSGPQFAGTPPHWMCYVHVADVDTCAGKVEAAGGKLAAAPFDVPGIGRICIIVDPTGAALGLITPVAMDSAG